MRNVLVGNRVGVSLLDWRKGEIIKMCFLGGKFGIGICKSEKSPPNAELLCGCVLTKWDIYAYFI